MIIVTGDPEIVRNLQDTYVTLYNKVVLSCEFINIEHFSWWRDGQKIPLTLDKENYTINGFDPNDQGYYYCIGLTKNGKTIESHQALVKIQGNSMVFCCLIKAYMLSSQESNIPHLQMPKICIFLYLHMASDIKQTHGNDSDLKTFNLVNILPS